jgi:hypothetical protein
MAHFHSEKFLLTENVQKISLFKVENFLTENLLSANHILQNFLSAENFPEWK